MSLKIDKLQFDIGLNNGDMKYVGKLYNCVSYEFTCKNDNRLENLPIGPFKFTYNNHVYTFSNNSKKLNKLKTRIIEVFILYTNY